MVLQLADDVARSRGKLFLGRAYVDYSGFRFSRRDYRKPHRPLGLRLVCLIHHPRGQYTPRYGLFGARLIPSKEVQGSFRGSFSSRGFIPERFRAAFIYVDHCLVTSESVSVSSLIERCRRVHVSIPVWEVPQKKKRTSCAYANVYQAYEFQRD